MESALLKVRNLKVHFPTQDGLVKAVNGVNYNLKKRDSGHCWRKRIRKECWSTFLLRLISSRDCRVSGNVFFEGQDLMQLNAFQMRQIRGYRISMIFRTQ